MENEIRKQIDNIKNFKLNENLEIPVNSGEAFKRELKELLTKYDADIYVDLEGDTHGVSAMIVIDVNNKEVIRKHSDLSQYDIK